MENIEWQVTTNRFVLFFDVLGFKDLVMKNSHDEVLSKLTSIKHVLKAVEKFSNASSSFKIIEKQTRVVTFSDSIIIFSKGDTSSDMVKIHSDGLAIMGEAVKAGLPIKGAIAFGEVTADFENSLFFGQPIIDAYLLHEDLHMLGVIMEHNCENKLSEIAGFDLIKKREKISTKYGMVNHVILTSSDLGYYEELLQNVLRLYKYVSGTPRKYLDNTVDHLQNHISKIKKNLSN